jgi:hypothetical protein
VNVPIILYCGSFLGMIGFVMGVTMQILKNVRFSQEILDIAIVPVAPANRVAYV